MKIEKVVCIKIHLISHNYYVLAFELIERADTALFFLRYCLPYFSFEYCCSRGKKEALFEGLMTKINIILVHIVIISYAYFIRTIQTYF